MRTPARRLGAVALSTVLLTGTALVATPAQAAPANTSADQAAGWLAGQLTNGLAHNDQYAFDDQGLSLDIYFALQEIDTRPASRTAVLDALAAAPEDYISYAGAHYAGSTGKLATAAELGARDPRSFGGVDLVTRLEGLVHAGADAQLGRGVDSGGTDYSNTIGQAWIVRALVGAGSSRAADAVTFLLHQQCAAGFFRVTLEGTATTSPFTCDGAASGSKDPSIDTTAFAIEALGVARAAGVTGLDDEIAEAGDWLVSTQASDGSFQDMGAANTNSTGLAATALAGIGRTAPAASAATWIEQLRVSDAGAGANPKLAGEVGGIAYDAAALAAGKQDGIPVDQRDQWRRATAQAAPALQALPAPVTPAPSTLPAKTLSVSAPSGYRAAGSTVTVTVRGLQAGEAWTVALGSVAAKQGTAATTGVGTARFVLPRRTATYRVTATGSTASRSGADTLKALTPEKFGVSLRHRPVKRGGTERITVTGLAPHEFARLYFRGARVWSGRATEGGKVVRSFGARRSLGTKQVKLRGAVYGRSVTTHVRVVR